jgi:iron-sulfur cluster assembly protein
MDLPIINQSSGSDVKSLISLTPLAAEKVKELFAERGTPEQGLRVGVRGGGCSGHSYFMEFCDGETLGDHVVISEGVKLVVDTRSAAVLGGTQIDFVTGLMGSGFKFNNPNVRHSCSCGESFST